MQLVFMYRSIWCSHGLIEDEYYIENGQNYAEEK